MKTDLSRAMHRRLAGSLGFLIAGMLVCCRTVPAAADDEANRLLVYPPKIVVSPDHPARFCVLLRQGNGTVRDVTLADDLHVSLSDNSTATIVEDGMVVAKRRGASRLVVRYAGLRATNPLQVTKSPVPMPRFPVEVAAVLAKVGCNLGTCHGNLHGKAGFRLSLRGDDAAFDFASITRGAGGRRVDWLDPEASLLLKKPAGRVAHRGGERLPHGSPGYDMLRRWIEAGAEWDANKEATLETVADEPRVRRLTVWPREAWFDPASRRTQLAVIAEMADGTHRDVTRWAVYEASVVNGIDVSEEGRVVSDRPLDVTVSVRYLDARTASRLVFLEEREADFSLPLADSPIDRLIGDRLQRLRMPPAPLAEPTVFLRRLYLTVVGRLPRPTEIDAFLSEPALGRRERWVDRALAEPGYAELWALHWSDLLRNEPKVMSSAGAQSWHVWLASQFRRDRPLNEIVHDLVATTGSTLEKPPASFHRTHRDPMTAAEAVGQLFLGVRIQCARCHNHPFDVWRQDDYYGLAAYFTTIEREQVDNQPKDKLDKHIITGDELISLRDDRATIRHPGRSQEVPPKPLDQATWAAGELSDSHEPRGTPLQRAADWLTEGNRAFARNMANRIWFHAMGRGIVDPPDDFRDSNPPSHPELLEYLTDRLIASDYSTRRLMREILRSDAFARKVISQASSTEALDPAPAFAGYPLRRMKAEVLLDAISDATGVASQLTGGKQEQALRRAVHSADVPQDGFLKTFGKPDRLLSCECERSDDASLSQSLLLLNGDDVREKIAARPNRLDDLLNHTADTKECIRRLYRAVLTRQPTPAEMDGMEAYLTESENRRAAAEDILWALINSKEFSWIR